MLLRSKSIDALEREERTRRLDEESRKLRKSQRDFDDLEALKPKLRRRARWFLRWRLGIWRTEGKVGAIRHLKEMAPTGFGANYSGAILLILDIEGDVFFNHSGRADWFELRCSDCHKTVHTSPHLQDAGKNQALAEFGRAVKKLSDHKREHDIRDCGPQY
jgi:hypothetical protein